MINNYVYGIRLVLQDLNMKFLLSHIEEDYHKLNHKRFFLKFAFAVFFAVTPGFVISINAVNVRDPV